MKLLVIGASRGIGREVVRQALERGHEVRAFSRSAEDIPFEDSRLEKRAGDALKKDDVSAALAGVDAVILALGVDRNMRFVLGPVTLFSKATEVLVPAMEEAGVKRLLVVTGFGSGDSKARLSTAERAGMTLFLGRAYADKDVQERMIKASTLDWTIARPGILTSNKMTGRYQVLTDPATWRQGMISRADVAHFLLEAAEKGSHIHETPALQK